MYFEEIKERLAMCSKIEPKMAYQTMVELLDEVLQICIADVSSDVLQ